jgi:hypothetical protein
VRRQPTVDLGFPLRRRLARRSTASFEHDGAAVGRRLHGSVNLVVEAAAEVPLLVPAPWNAKPVAPAIVRRRLRGRSDWRTAVDV